MTASLHHRPFWTETRQSGASMLSDLDHCKSNYKRSHLAVLCFHTSIRLTFVAELEVKVCRKERQVPSSLAPCLRTQSELEAPYIHDIALESNDSFDGSQPADP